MTGGPLADRADFAALVAALDALSRSFDRAAAAGADDAAASGRGYAERAEALYARRRRRARLFAGGSAALQEPAWDILLRLFIAHEEGHPVPVAALTIEGEFGERVGKRWLTALEAMGWARCWPDPAAPDTTQAAITPHAVEMMLRYLDEG